MRHFLKAGLLAAMLLLLIPAAALAAPQWLGAESLDTGTGSATPADVASDADGNSVAVWLGPSGAVNAAYRPRGGPWGPTEDLDPGAPTSTGSPRVTAQPDGEFVAVWLANQGSGPTPLRWARRPAGGDWSAPDTITGIGCCPGIEALEASADGSVTVVSTDENVPSSNTKPPGSETWGPDESVPTGSGGRYAFGPDGSALAAIPGTCSETPCMRAAYRPPGGPWGEVVPIDTITSGAGVTGFEVAATPSAGYTVIWGESVIGDSTFDPPGRVRSRDRGPGADGDWGAASLLVADLPDDAPGCDFDGNCFDLAVGRDGTQLAVWDQTGANGDRVSAALRPSGGTWGDIEKVGDIGSSGAPPFAAITTTAVPVVAWGSAASGAARAHGSHRDASGTWDPVTLTAGLAAEGSASLGDIAADADGNALTAWADPTGVSAAGFDGSGPRFDTFSAPATGTVGATLPFSATADDNWSGLSSISWLFDDGGTAVGGAVNHAYNAPGAFTATATATDGIGNTTQASGPVAVSPVATPTPTPTPNPCGTADHDKDGINDGCDTSDGAKPPVAFKTVNATVVSGDVFIQLPGAGPHASAAAAKPPKGFVRLQGAQTIPVGSTLDTAKGRVKLRSAADTRHHVQSGQFFSGRFVIRQVRKPRGKSKHKSTKLITELRLTGSSFAKTCKTKRTVTASASAKRRSKKRVRRLFGDGKGSFRTRGRNAAATVRGTRWGVQDRCDGTLVTVQRGVVSVRDLVKHKTVSVKTGHTYLARRR